MSGCSKPKTPPTIPDFDLPIKRGRYVPTPRPPHENQRTLKCRLRRHAWYVRTYVSHPREEPPCDPIEIQARIALVRREKDLLRAVGRVP